MLRLLPLFILLPLVDLLLLLWIGSRIGAGPALALVLVTGFAGAVLAKLEGLRVLRSYRAALASGRLPEEGVLSGLLVLLGAALLVAPGVITDGIGLILLVPPTRRAVAAFLRRRLERRIVVFSGGRMQPRSARDQVIDVESRPVREP